MIDEGYSNYSKNYVANATTDFISKNIDKIVVEKSQLTIGKKFDKIIIIFNKNNKAR